MASQTLHGECILMISCGTLEYMFCSDWPVYFCFIFIYFTRISHLLDLHENEETIWFEEHGMSPPCTLIIFFILWHLLEINVLNLDS